MVDASVYVFDPTATDVQSRVRGVGRYVETVMEALGASGKLVSSLSAVPEDAILINPFFNLLGQPLLKKRVARRQIAVIHDLIPFKYPRSFPIGLRGKLTVWSNKGTLNNYDKIITDSLSSRADIERILGLHEEKISVIYPSIASVFITDFVPNPSEAVASLIADNPRYFLYVGDVTWNKNLANLARAVKIAHIPCIFVGKSFSGPAGRHPWQQELELFRREAGADPLFIFPGFVSNNDLIYLYRHAIANLLVSHDEGFGFSYLEAGAQRCPSVLADRPIFHEISAENAVFANPENPQDIAGAMKQLAESPGGRTEMGMKAFARSQFFSTKEFRTALLKTVLL